MTYPNEVIVGATRYVPGLKLDGNFYKSYGNVSVDDISSYFYLSMIRYKKLLTKNFLLLNRSSGETEEMMLTQEQIYNLKKGRVSKDVLVLLPNYSYLWLEISKQKTSLAEYLLKNNVDLSGMITIFMQEALGVTDFFDIELIHVTTLKSGQQLCMRVNFNLKYNENNIKLLGYLTLLALFTYYLGTKITQERALKEVIRDIKNDPGIVQISQYMDGNEYGFVHQLNRECDWSLYLEELALNDLKKDVIASSFACYRVSKQLALSEVKR